MSAVAGVRVRLGEAESAQPWKTRRLPSPDGAVAGAPKVMLVPTSRWMAQGVVQVDPSTCMVIPAGTLDTLIWEIGWYVAVRRTSSGALVTVYCWLADPPFDQETNLYRRPCASVWVNGADTLWLDPC